MLMVSPPDIGEALAPLGLSALQLETVLTRAHALVRTWLTITPNEMRALIRDIVHRVAISQQRIDVTIGIDQLARTLGASENFDGKAGSTTLSIAAQLRRAGQGKRLVIGDPYHAGRDAGLVNILKEAFAARGSMLAETSETLNEITARTTKSKGRLTALLRVSYLAPDLISDILAGRQPTELSVKRLLRISRKLPLAWDGQRAFLGMG